MRHRFSGRHLNMNGARRAAMFRSMAVALIKHEKIRSTLPRAKELRRVVEPLITRSKGNDTPSNRRIVFGKLRDKEALAKLFTELGPHFADRPGGYLRILKSGLRSGDNAQMATTWLVGRSKDLYSKKGEDNEKS